MKGTLLGGRYLLLEELGTGGEARVHRARDTAAAIDVAIRFGHPNGATPDRPVPPVLHEGWVNLLATGTDPTHGAYQIFELLEGRLSINSSRRRRWTAKHGGILSVNRSKRSARCTKPAGVTAISMPEIFFEPARAGNCLSCRFNHSPLPPDGAPSSAAFTPLRRNRSTGQRPMPVPISTRSVASIIMRLAADYPHAGPTSQDIAIDRLRFDPEPLEAKARQLPAA